MLIPQYGTGCELKSWYLYNLNSIALSRRYLKLAQNSSVWPIESDIMCPSSWMATKVSVLRSTIELGKPWKIENLPESNKAVFTWLNPPGSKPLIILNVTNAPKRYNINWKVS